MKFLVTQKVCVPRVPRVPKLLKAFKYGAFEIGTQQAISWNTSSMAHKRCSKVGNTSRLNGPLLTGGFLASPGAGARVSSVTQTGQGGNND
jgi:hypothetical protein